MSEPFVGEIRMFAGNFAPRGWAFCDGQLLSISQNEALFALFGTTYGGDGRTTFGLPDARGRVALHQGTGPGLTSRPLGQKSGVEDVTINTNQLPVHSHVMSGSNLVADEANPGGNLVAQTSQFNLYQDGAPDPANPLNAQAITEIGGDQQHTNLQPFLCINCIVALFGIFPSRQ